MIVAGTQECGGREACVSPAWPDSLPELIRRSAAKRPSADAVRLGVATLSYGELDRQSDRLTRKLLGLGVGRNVLVGLLVERTPAMVVALLAVLKAGAGYVPLDPSYPVARIDGMLEDAGVELLISETGVVARLGLTYRAGVLLLDGEANEDEADADLAMEYRPEDTAYVIFTSGSTGKPKGVEISHGALVNVLLSMRDEPGMQADEVLLAVTSLAFDIAAVEMFLPLIAGGTIEMASQEEVSNPAKLLAKLNGCGATILQATPVTWRLLMLAGWTAGTPVRVWCGGEEMTETLARDLLARSAEVWNLYGPTETTIWSSLMRVRDDEGAISLGTPVAHTSLFVLDEDRREVSDGVAGELYIGGAGLAKGYWRQPELTRASFPTVRLGDGRTVRHYKTGDRVRRCLDGRLEFLGRLDRQVKLRGYRIELSEIEYAARGCAGINEVVVVKVEDAERDASLAAFAVAKDGQTFEAAGLRHYLATRLPQYMIPSAIRMVKSLPVTANGKLDRKRLISVTTPELVVLDAFDEPHEGLESRLARMWSEALGVTHVGRHDNFFGMGGDSLLAAQVETEMAQRVDARCSVGSLLRAPTIASYAALLGGLGVPTSVLLNAGRTAEDGIFWMDNPDRLPRLAGLLGERRFYSMLLSPEDIAREAPRYPLERLAARVVDHMLGLQAGGRFTVGGFCQNALLAYEVAQQLQARGLEVPLLVMIDPVDHCETRKADFSWGMMMRRVEREWFHLRAMLRLAPSGWRGYLRQRYEGMRFELEGRRWQRAARGGSLSPRPVPELAQALFASRLSYAPRPYAGRVLFVEPTLRPQANDPSRAEAWSRLVTAGRWCAVVGDHLGLFASPAVENLAVAVKKALDEVTASS